jgi:hypothetical protein
MTTMVMTHDGDDGKQIAKKVEEALGLHTTDRGGRSPRRSAPDSRRRRNSVLAPWSGVGYSRYDQAQQRGGVSLLFAGSLVKLAPSNI